MSTRTNTTAQQVFHRRDSNNVHHHAIFQFNSDASRPRATRITLPEKSTWSPGPHWHEQHTEYFQVIQGRVSFTINGVSTIVAPEDGVQRVDRFVVHTFCRADKDLHGQDKDVGDVVTEEWTDPADGVKHVFFRNVFSTLQDSNTYWGHWTTLQVLLVAASYDDFIDILPGKFSYATTHLFYGSVQLLGRLLGLRSWHEEYTPVELREVAQGGKPSKSE